MSTLQEELQEIIEALGGDNDTTPPPGTRDKLKWYLDLIETTLREGGVFNKGTLTLPDEYFFDTPDDRDTYFNENPDKLAVEDDVFCSVAGTLQKYISTEIPPWVDVSALIRGPKGDSIEIQNSGTYIQWRVAGTDTWNNLIELSSLKGENGDNVDIQIDDDYIQWKHSSDGTWQDLIALSLLKGSDGIPVIWKGNFSSPPENPKLNWAYYNTTQKKSFIHNGTSWDIMTQDGASEGLPEAPDDGKQYARKNLEWSEVAAPITDYDDLTNKPSIDGLTLDKDSTSAGLGLETAADAGDNDDLETTEKDTLVGAINEVNSAVATETENREAYDEQQDQKIQTLNGHYYPIEPYDFGKTLDVKTPVPEDITALTDYAMTEEDVTEPAQIIDGTVIKNLFDDVEFVWNAVDQKWVDFGIGNIVTASNDHLGVVEGTADPGDGSQDGMVTVHPGGGMEAIGFRDLKNRMEDAEETIADKMDRSGDGMTGDLDMDGHKVIAVGQLDVAEIRSITGIAGDSVKVSGILDLESYRITDVGDPVDDRDAATKKYVDTGLSGVPGGFTASKTYGNIPGPNVPPVGVSIKLGNTAGQFYFGTVTLRQNNLGKTVKFDYGIYADTETAWNYFTVTKILNDYRNTSVWFYRDTSGNIFLYLDLEALATTHHFIEATCTQTNNGTNGNGGEKYMLPSYTWETETPAFTDKTSSKIITI
jgi:hypothetical protein